MNNKIRSLLVEVEHLEQRRSVIETKIVPLRQIKYKSFALRGLESTAVLCKVFSFLDCIQDLPNCAMVSKSWNKAAKCPLSIETLYFDMMNPKALKALHNMDPIRWRNVRKLVTKALDDEFFSYNIVQNMKRLHEAHLKYDIDYFATEGSLESLHDFLAQNSGTLEYLSLASVWGEQSANLPRLPAVLDMRCENCHLSVNSFNNCPLLEHLTLSECCIPDHSEQDFQAKSLRSLSVYLLQDATGTFAPSSIIASSPNVECLQVFCNAEAIDDESWDAMRSLRKLKFLCLSDFQTYDVQNLAGLPINKLMLFWCCMEQNDYISNIPTDLRLNKVITMEKNSSVDYNNPPAHLGEVTIVNDDNFDSIWHQEVESSLREGDSDTETRVHRPAKTWLYSGINTSDLRTPAVSNDVTGNVSEAGDLNDELLQALEAVEEDDISEEDLSVVDDEVLWVD